MTAAVVLGLMIATTPLLDVENRLDRGATSLYTISLVEELEYWVILELPDEGSDFDAIIASKEMDFDEFMNLPFHEDFMYAREFVIAEGILEGPESFTLQAPYTGPFYIVIHDIGESGGRYHLKVY